MNTSRLLPRIVIYLSYSFGISSPRESYFMDEICFIYNFNRKTEIFDTFLTLGLWIECSNCKKISNLDKPICRSNEKIQINSITYRNSAYLEFLR